jgi:hypothetical protein
VLHIHNPNYDEPRHLLSHYAVSLHASREATPAKVLLYADRRFMYAAFSQQNSIISIDKANCCLSSLKILKGNVWGNLGSEDRSTFSIYLASGLNL